MGPSPWNIPQSIMRRSVPVSTRYCDPVTVLAAPRKVSRGMGGGGSLAEHLSQDGLEDPAVAVGVDLDGGVQAGQDGEGAPGAVGPRPLDPQLLPRPGAAADAGAGERLPSGETAR